MKFKLRTFVLCVLPLTLITACKDDVKNVDYYVNHHSEMLDKYKQCMIFHTWSEIECGAARDASRIEGDKPDVKAGLIRVKTEVLKMIEEGKIHG